MVHASCFQLISFKRVAIRFRVVSIFSSGCSLHLPLLRVISLGRGAVGRGSVGVLDENAVFFHAFAVVAVGQGGGGRVNVFHGLEGSPLWLSYTVPVRIWARTLVQRVNVRSSAKKTLHRWA